MKKERGYMLITALLIMGTLAAFGIAFYLTSNTNTLTALNELKGEELRYLAESGARMALSIYREETGPIEVVSWKEVYNYPESGFEKLIEGVVEESTYTGMCNDSDPQLIKFLGKATREKKDKNGGVITREILVNAKPISSPSPAPTPTPSPNVVVNSGNRKAVITLKEAVNKANPGDVIYVVQTGKTDREGGGETIKIDKPLHIIGVYKPTNGSGGDEEKESRVLIRNPIIITADNVTIEGLWIDPVNYLPIEKEDPQVRDGEKKTGCYVKSSVNGVTTDDPNVECTKGNGIDVPKHKGAAIIVKSGGNIIIRNNVIARGTGSYDVGVYVAHGVKGVLIDHNTFVDTQDVNTPDKKCDYGSITKDAKNGNTAIVINNVNSDTYATITNNIFAYSKCDYTIGVEVLGKRGETTDSYNEPFVQCIENDFWNNTLAMGNTEGFGVYGENPKFVNWAEGIFVLSDESPLKGMDFDDEDLGVAYESSIFRDITIVDWEHSEYFESLAAALQYAIDEERIRVDKVIPVETRAKPLKEQIEKEMPWEDPFLTKTPILTITQNKLHIYSTKGPVEDTRIPLFVDVVGDEIEMEGLKFKLAGVYDYIKKENVVSVIDKFEKIRGDIRGMGVVNMALALLLKEKPGNRYRYHWHNNCWVNCMKDCKENNLGEPVKNNAKHGFHFDNYGCHVYCKEHYKDEKYCGERKGIRFTLKNSIIIRPGTKEFGLNTDPNEDNSIAGISGGYLEEATLTHVIITSLGQPAYGDGVRFINISDPCKNQGRCSFCGHHHGHWHYGRGKFTITNSIITGYIAEGKIIDNKNKEEVKGKRNPGNGGGGNNNGNSKFDIVGVNASFTDKACSTRWNMAPCKGKGCQCNSCNVDEESGSCNCGSFTVCILPFWGPHSHWGEAIEREISISKSDLWGNTCDIKYEGFKDDWKGKHWEGLSSVKYSYIVGVNPGFSFGVPENQKFRIGPPLSNCKCNFEMGIEWEKFNK